MLKFNLETLMRWILQFVYGMKDLAYSLIFWSGDWNSVRLRVQFCRSKHVGDWNLFGFLNVGTWFRRETRNFFILITEKGKTNAKFYVKMFVFVFHFISMIVQ